MPRKGQTNKRKPFRETKTGQWLLNIANGALGGAVNGITTSASETKEITDASETKFGQFLGKYKGWLIAGSLLVVGSLVIFFGTQIKKFFK